MFNPSHLILYYKLSDVFFFSLLDYSSELLCILPVKTIVYLASGIVNYRTLRTALSYQYKLVNGRIVFSQSSGSQQNRQRQEF